MTHNNQLSLDLENFKQTIKSMTEDNKQLSANVR